MSVKINKNGKEYDLGFIPEHYPADRVYLDGDTSKTVQDAVNRGSVSVTADGQKTYATLLNELFALANLSKINVNSKLKIYQNIAVVNNITSSFAKFSWVSIYSQKEIVIEYKLASSSSVLQWYNNVYSDVSSGKPNSGEKITLYY